MVNVEFQANLWYNSSCLGNVIQSGGFFIYDPQGLKWMLPRHQLRQPAGVTAFKGVKGMTTGGKLITVQCPDCLEFRQIYDKGSYRALQGAGGDGKRRCPSCAQRHRWGVPLDVITRYRDRSKYPKMTVQCPDCGEWREVFKEKGAGNRKCMGCSRTHKTSPLQASKNKVIKMYQAMAKQRSLSWNLTGDQFFHLVKQSCHYCGIEPSNTQLSKSKRAKEETCFVYSGVDRKDNSIGYTVENCVPCCRTCNWAKGTMSHNEFIEWVCRVAEFSCGKIR